MTDERRNATRAPISITVDFRRSGRTPFKVKLVDLSRTGCHAETVSRTNVGDAIWITLPGLAPIEGVVRWNTSRGFGCEWAAPMHESIFDHIMRAHPYLQRE